MDIRKNKTIKQKMLITCISVIMIFTFIFPKYSMAIEIENLLFSPVRWLVTSIADSAMTLVQWCFTGKLDGVASKKGDAQTNTSKWATKDGKDIPWPELEVTPEEIFHGKVLALNVNFIKGYTAEADSIVAENGNTESSLNKLRETISKWYMALRNISIVGLLSILVYIGIRMIISSTAVEKAKYKQMIMDWVIALCLIFFLHYIMAFTMQVVESINDMFASATVTGINIPDTIDVEGEGPQSTVSNLMEYARLYVYHHDVSTSFAFLIVYVWLVVYTIRFILVYTKRFIHMAFLTLIAPLVALTYPLDKIKDGQAQAFNMWLKDYIFNALIQPFHLLLYTIFVSLAMDFATENLIYACVAIGFIAQAEKYMKKLFGFDKAPSAPGALGSFTGGALASQAISKLRSGSGKSGGNGGKESSSGGGKPPRTSPGYEGYIGEGGNGGYSDADHNGSKVLSEEERAKFEQRTGNNQPANGQNEQQVKQNNTPPAGLISGKDEPAPKEGEKNEKGNIDKENDDRGIGQWAKDGFNKHIGSKVGAGARRLADKARTSKPGTKLTGMKNGLNRGIKRIPKPIRNTIKGVSKATGKRFKSAGKAVLRAAPKVALGAAGSIVGGAAMGLHALATGKEPDDILKSAVMGAAGGAVFANKATGAVTNAGRNFAYDVHAGYDKEGADAKLDKKAFMKNEANKEFVKRNFTANDGTELRGKELKSRMEQSYAMYQAGITDEATRKKVMSLEDKINGEMNERLDKNDENYEEQLKKNRELARQQALITHDMSKEWKVSEIMGKEDMIKSNISANIIKTAKERGVNMTQEQVDNNAELAFNRLADYKGVPQISNKKDVKKDLDTTKNDTKATKKAPSNVPEKDGK